MKFKTLSISALLTTSFMAATGAAYSSDQLTVINHIIPKNYLTLDQHNSPSSPSPILKGTTTIDLPLPSLTAIWVDESGKHPRWSPLLAISPANQHGGYYKVLYTPVADDLTNSPIRTKICGINRKNVLECIEPSPDSTKIYTTNPLKGITIDIRRPRGA